MMSEGARLRPIEWVLLRLKIRRHVLGADAKVGLSTANGNALPQEPAEHSLKPCSSPSDPPEFASQPLAFFLFCHVERFAGKPGDSASFIGRFIVCSQLFLPNLPANHSTFSGVSHSCCRLERLAGSLDSLRV